MSNLKKYNFFIYIFNYYIIKLSLNTKRNQVGVGSDKNKVGLCCRFFLRKNCFYFNIYYSKFNYVDNF